MSECRPSNSRSEWRVLLAITAIAFLIRLLAIREFGPSTIRFGDAPDYLRAAASVCSASIYPDRSALPFFRAPGLPFFVAVITLCHTDLVPIVKLALATLDVLSVWIVFLLARELFRDRVIGLVAAAISAVYPFFVAEVCDVQTEPLFLFLYLLSIWLTLRALRAQASTRMLMAGACASAAALVRPVGLMLIPLLLAGIFGLGLRGQRRKLAGLLAGGAALCLAPWVVRNAVHYHELILVNNADGYNFWRGTSPEIYHLAQLRNRQAFQAASLQFETVTSPAIAREIDRAADTPAARNRAWYRRAILNFRSEPSAFCLRLARNAWVYWRPWLNPQTSSKGAVVASGLLVSLLYLFAAAGWTILWKRRQPLACWWAACLLTLWIVQIPFQVVSRFRVPVADPLLIILAAGSLAVFRRNVPATSAS